MGSYIPTTDAQRAAMLAAVGCSTLEELFDEIPAAVRLENGCDLPNGLSELAVRREMERLAARNKVYRSVFRGAGAYRHYIPEIVRAVTAKEEFVTAYTPYQAEISQGVLQSIFEYQTMICRLTGMDSANASVYDGACAAAEAVAMCRDRGRTEVLVSATSHPDTIEVIRTYCFGSGMQCVLVPQQEGAVDMEFLARTVGAQTACLFVQHPNYYGVLEDAAALGALVHAAGGKYILGVNPISLGALKTPADYGADIAVGDGQPLGMPLGFGGPYLGFMACRAALTRKLPGRIVGETVDTQGRRGFVLTLQAREQHIRREKASSNICSNQALCAMTATAYLAAMGAQGVQEAALQSAAKAAYLQQALAQIGFALCWKKPFFHEFVTTTPIAAHAVEHMLDQAGILSGYPLEAHKMLWCCTEMNTKEEIDALIGILKGGIAPCA